MVRKGWTRAAAIMAIASLGVIGAGLVGMALVDGDFPAVWMVVVNCGLTLLIVSVVLWLGFVIARRGHHMDDAYEAGYRAGFKAGRRTGGLRVVPFDRDRAG